MIRVRSARAEEADALTALCLRSKAHWGYDAEFMRQSAKGLTVTAAMIAEARVLVAEDPDGDLLGVAAVAALPTQGKFDLSLLFVESSAIRTEVGRVLFEAATSFVQRQGASSLSILADPFAAAFYQHLGAVEIGDALSDAIPGRRLPPFEYEIHKSATLG